MRKIIGIPAAIWYGVFFFIPLLLVVAMSFATRGAYGRVEWTFTWMNYFTALQPAYVSIFFNSLLMAAVTGFICIVLSFFAAWKIAAMLSSKRIFWISILMLPSISNLVIRVYATKLSFGMNGPIQWLLNVFGFDFDPFAMTANIFLVYYGLITTYLPFALFPIYSSFEKFDFQLVEAARDLGASITQTVFKVIIPGQWPSLMAGFSLVLIPCLGEFVIPDLLGGAKEMMLGNLIVENFLRARNWPVGSAIAVSVFLVVGFSTFLFIWVTRRVLGKKSS